MGGSYIAPRTVEAGKALGASERPVRDGYSFDGWYTDRNCTKLYSIDTPVYSDFVLYAGWTKINNEHVVNFETNGGTYMSPVTVQDGGSLNKRGLEGTTRDGYTFEGWYYDRGLRSEYSYGTPIYEDITLYANWEQIKNDHTVSFVTNGGTAMSPVTVQDGGSLNQRGLEGTTRSGYIFDGW